MKNQDRVKQLTEMLEYAEEQILIQGRLKEEWKELAADLMKKYMDQYERDQLLLGVITTYVEKKVRNV